MKIIIDTHIFLWSLSNPALISPTKLKELESPTNIIFVSSISIAEIMLKASIGKLKIDFNPVELAQQSGFEPLEFTAQDALLLKEMPFHHKDPFDRMLVCQSLNNSYSPHDQRQQKSPTTPIGRGLMKTPLRGHCREESPSRG